MLFFVFLSNFLKNTNNFWKKTNITKKAVKYLFSYLINNYKTIVVPPTQGTWHSKDYVSAIRLECKLVVFI